MVSVRDIIKSLNHIAPFAICEAWDNSGLQVGNPAWEVKKVMVGLDVSLGLLTAAIEQNADLVLTHHPLILRPEKIIDFSEMPGKVIQMAANHKISVVSVHTNIDKSDNGLNDFFAARIGIRKTTVLSPDAESLKNTGGVTGIGRIGQLSDSTSLEQFALDVKDKLCLQHVRVIGDLEKKVASVAMCTGSGGSLLDVFFESGADVYVTGDIKYHEARLIEEKGRGLIDVGHFGSEHMVVDLLSETLGKACGDEGIKIEIKRYGKENDPFNIM